MKKKYLLLSILAALFIGFILIAYGVNGVQGLFFKREPISQNKSQKTPTKIDKPLVEKIPYFTLNLKAGESISSSDGKLLLNNIKSDGTAVFSFFYNFNGKFVKKGAFNLNSEKTMHLNAFSKLGLNIEFVDSDFNSQKVKIKKYEDCATLYQQCVENPSKYKNSTVSDKQNKPICTSLCLESAVGNEETYDSGKFIGIFPIEYKENGILLTESMNFCYQKEKDFLDFDIPYKNIYVKKIVANAGTGLVAFAPTILNYDTPENIEIKKTELETYKNQIKDGVCPTYAAQPHELNHLFMNGTPLIWAYTDHPVSWLNEGLASYIQDNIINANPQFPIKCGDKTFEIGGVEKQYLNLSNTFATSYDAYATGACFWDYIVKNYGESKFKEILKKLDQLRYQQITLYFFKDIVNPIAGDDVFYKTKDVFGFYADMIVSNIPVLKQL